MIFSRGRPRTYNFMINNEIIEAVKEYKYSGFLFSRSGSFLATKKHLACRAEKAIYNLIKKKARTLLLSIDMQMEIFDKIVNLFLL